MYTETVKSDESYNTF